MSVKSNKLNIDGSDQIATSDEVEQLKSKCEDVEYHSNYLDSLNNEVELIKDSLTSRLCYKFLDKIKSKELENILDVLNKSNEVDYRNSSTDNITDHFIDNINGNKNLDTTEAKEYYCSKCKNIRNQ